MSFFKQTLMFLLSLLMTSTGGHLHAQLLALPENANTIGVLVGDETYLDIGFLGWGPNWQYLGFRGSVTGTADVSSLTSSANVRASGAEVASKELDFCTSEERIPAEPGMEDWFEFRPSRDYESPCEIGLESWLEKPAGKHGRITRNDDQLVYDGQPIKLWGTNVCYSSCAPDRELAEQRARFYARYGINSVRLHKYADGTGWAGIQT